MIVDCATVTKALQYFISLVIILSTAILFPFLRSRRVAVLTEDFG